MYLKMLFRSLTRRRSRLAAAMLAVAVGAAAFQGMTMICRDVPRQMEREFRSYGANMLLVAAGGDALSLSDVSRAAALLPEDKLIGVTPYRYKSVRTHMQPLTAAGTNFGMVKKTSPWWRVDGAWPAGGGEILAGANVAEFMGLAPGHVLEISGRNAKGARFTGNVKVAGVVRTGGVEEDFIFMSLPELEALDGISGAADAAEVSVALGAADLEIIAEKIRAEIPSVAPRLVKRVTSSETSVLTRLRALMYLVTAVVLILTMICVAATMMTVVMERRKEIGLKKALGAENRAIAAEFLGEGVCIGAVGSLPGTVIGWIFARAIGLNVFGRAIDFNFYLAPTTIIVSIVITAIACLIPIRAALDVEPALVLRGE
jgi:putative ABC transport system permease protein